MRLSLELHQNPTETKRDRLERQAEQVRQEVERLRKSGNMCFNSINAVVKASERYRAILAKLAEL
jgi:hypothetical protein